MNLTCKSCSKNAVDIFYELNDVPAQSVLNIATREKALGFPRGKISLGFCRECGFIFNVAFDPELLEYDTGYEATQSYSGTFSEFARRQARKLVDRYDLHDKALVEIGCGNGEFLTLLCEMGNNRGIGFDPAYVPGRVVGRNNVELRFVKDYYSEKYTNIKADFLYCKMTLEHIDGVKTFVKMVHSSIGAENGTAVFFQVPDVTRILRDCAFEDIYYEHCSYFSPGSLARLFRRSGFDVLDLETDYAGQYVMIDAKPAGGNVPAASVPEEDDFEKLERLVADFPGKLHSKISQWREQIERFCGQNKRIVIWGAGSKGVAFFTTIGVKDEIRYAVDINPHRQGTFMAGTGQKIVSPDFLKHYRPDVVIVMNAVYKEEIERALAARSLRPKILTL